MKLSEFDYKLPHGMIAQFPACRRTQSRMLVVDRAEKLLTDAYFYELPTFLNASYFLVLNDSRVLKARLIARRQTGGSVEVFLVRRIDANTWVCLLRPSGKIKAGEKLYLDGKNTVTVLDNPGPAERRISFLSDKMESFIIQQYGQVPLPPYIKRQPDNVDLSRYQTVYAERNGSVAAPTAGLHFDRHMLARLGRDRITFEKITLHVGPGTFKPVVTEKIENHTVDPEYAQVTSKTARAINRYKQEGKKLLAVGTTSVRTVEHVSNDAGLVSSFSGMVDLFIYPPYQFRAVGAMLTNFHLPKTSLLMLVAAFCGRDLLMKAYHHAIEEKYRFYSYGDCMLIL